MDYSLIGSPFVLRRTIPQKFVSDLSIFVKSKQTNKQCIVKQTKKTRHNNNHHHGQLAFESINKYFMMLQIGLI